MITESGKEIKNPSELQSNRIICVGDNIDLSSAAISFSGKGNILYLESPLRIANSKISFGGDNALVYLSANSGHVEYLKIDAWRETTTYIGQDNYFSGTLSCVVSERKNLIIGGGGVFSFGIWIRTADPHLLYSVDNMKRINPSQNVLIGDHVWLGQSCMILKGSRIGSGSVIGAASVVTNKRVESNTVYTGNPAKKVRTGIFFDSRSVHNFTSEQTEASQDYIGHDHIFSDPNGSINMETLDDLLEKARTAEEKLQVIQKYLSENNDSRFCIL